MREKKARQTGIHNTDQTYTHQYKDRKSKKKSETERHTKTDTH